MDLRFDQEKLDMPFQKSISANELSVEARFYFGQPSVLSAETELEISEHISRIGGFDFEAIDKNTFDIISNF